MRWLILMVPLLCAGCYCSHVRGAADAGTDAAAPRDAGTDAPQPPMPDAGPLCMLTAANADVGGTSPLGTFRFEHAFAGRGNTSKACFEVALHATGAASIGRTEPLDQLWVWIPRGVETVGIHTDVWFTLALDGAEATTDDGVVEVVRYERDGDPAIEARITIAGDGWDVQGTLVASYCGRFRDPCL